MAKKPRKPKLDLDKLTDPYLDRLQPVVEELRNILAKHGHKLIVKTDNDGKLVFYAPPKANQS